jgi:TonB family protein
VPIEQPSIAHLPEIQHVAPTPAPVIHTNVFSATNTSTADAAKSRPSVQAAGFGDPNGIPSSKTATRSVIPVNAFGAEPGAGGTGRARSVQTVQTGFTSGPAGTGTGTATGPRTVAGVRPTQFDQPQAPTTTQNKPAPQRSARITPVEIQSKPAPVYTEQARQKHIEGEVLLDVVFTASGEVRIIGVARGLGYGLDEAAIKAARLIRFSPAMRDGERVDYPATLHITFALS